MEEVDKIIIHSLREIGCDIGDDVNTLGQFSTNLIVEASVKCLEIISPGLGVPSQLPQNLAARFHVGTSIAEACKEMGYNGEIGYQTFLYSNVTDVRRVFMFLIEKLPKESEKTVIEPDDPLHRLKKEIGVAIKEHLANRLKPTLNSNVPFIALPLQSGITLPGQKMDCTPQEWRDFCINKLKFITEQVEYSYFFPSVITFNAKGNLKNMEKRSKEITPVRTPTSGIRPKPRSTFQNTWLGIRGEMLFSSEIKVQKEISEDQILKTSSKEGDIPENVSGKERMEEEEEEEKKQKEILQIGFLKERVDELKNSIETVSDQIAVVQEKYKSEEILVRDKIKDVEVRRKALTFLNESESNMKKLQEVIDTATQRLFVLSNEWEKRRKPLISRYREARIAILNKASESEKKMETVEELKSKLDYLNKQIVVKQSMKMKLDEEYEKLPKDINRSAYTKRILEIIGNIKKQKEDIDKILKDTKGLQKDINSDTGRLDRSFTVTDEVIYRNAKKDETCKRAYKLLVTLHSDCADIVSMVEETGVIVREIRVLEEQIETEKAKNISSNLERIKADLQQMNLETEMLKSQLKIIKA